MTAQQITINFPYYQINVNGAGGVLNDMIFSFQATDGGVVGGLTQDEVAEALRDFFAGQPGYTSSQISKYEAVQTIL